MKHTRIIDLQTDLKNGAITLPAVVNTYLETIAAHQNLNAFLEIFEEEAKQKAIEIQARITAGTAGKLAGLVLSIKDNICYKDHHCSAASKILEGFISLYSATVIERLLKEDAIIIGRTNCDEFAMGSSTENSAYGIVRNAANSEYVPGGSSGGAAVSVQAGMCHAALGSDTGGSIRQPSAFTGTYGFKPTYGRVSRWGLIAYGSSFDQIGPITRSVEDAALIMEVMAGTDEHDATASVTPVEPYSQHLRYEGKASVAVLRECYEHEGIHPEIRAAMEAQIAQLKQKGHSVTIVDFPYIDYMIPVYYILTTAEASSNLSRFDGVRYGYRSPGANTLESVYKKSRSEGFGAEVQRRIMLGTFVLSEGYYDAYYSKAQKVRRLITDKTNSLLTEHDFILLPTTPTPPFKLGEKAGDPIALYLADIFTAHANLAGIPAFSYPVATSGNGLPIGLQLMSRSFSEQRLFAFVKSLELK